MLVAKVNEAGGIKGMKVELLIKDSAGDAEKALSLAKQLVEELDRIGFPPELLEVEITETSMIGDVDRARPLLMLLRSRGIRIALDDFGTGYSSLALLRNMPINKVKIDRSFILDVEGSEGTGLTIVNAILGIAKAMNLQVTAEGIETVKVSEFLRDMGCTDHSFRDDKNGQAYTYVSRCTGLRQGR